MITNKDLEIENISYTNKDFGQIYPELLELTKKLTNKWNPQATNESEPGVVLLKLNAFIGDKLNYNIDKNTLEQFTVSATQETSMRRITEMLAYNMRYYRSATTKISFRYTGAMGKADSEKDIEKLNDFKIKAFDTEFKTSEDVVYTLLEDILVTSADKLCTGKLAIQGTLQSLNVLQSDNNQNSTLIQLYNLDGQNRVYFPVPQVAENGIFINKEVYDKVVHKDAWHRVDNLNDQELGSKVFKFGYDSNKELPYIEFPSDIADLIEDGLEIDYIVSNGERGKVANGDLKTFSKLSIVSDSDSAFSANELSESEYILSNSDSTQAYDPETLTEAYNNSKKVSGTFNTLVSCRDYSNYLNRYMDDSSKAVVSNVVATDLRTDPEYSKLTFIRDKTGASYYKNILTEDVTANPQKMYDVILHGTIPVNQAITTQNQYDKTYQPLAKSDTVNISSAIEEVKTINHSLVPPEDKKLAFIEADYTLKANLSTKYKVNISEQKEIVKNIKTALYSAFNAREVEFGEEIPFDTLLNVIENADTRIKNVSLDNPDIKYNVITSGIGLTSKQRKVAYDPKTHIDLIIDNVRAGSLPLYKENTDFSYDYSMDLSSENPQLKNLIGITGMYTANKGHKLQKNESIQLVEDSYLTDVIYPAYVYYALYSDNTNLIIKKDTTYKLGENDKLYVYYTDTASVQRLKTYKQNDIIKPTLDLVATNGSNRITATGVTAENKVASRAWNVTNKKLDTDIDITSVNYEASANIIPLFCIGSDEEIDILKRNEITLPENSNAFWYIKPRYKVNTGNTPFDNATNEEGSLILTEDPYDNTKFSYILEEDELFIYPNEDMTSLNIVGSGTKLECPKLPEDGKQLVIKRLTSDIIDLTTLEDSIEDEDVGTFRKSFNWQTIPDRKLTVVESTISTFVEGETVTDCDAAIEPGWKVATKLVMDDAEVVLSEETHPLIRSVLSINSSSTEPQKILEGQSIALTYADKEEEKEGQSINVTVEPLIYTAGKETYFQFSPELSAYYDLGLLQTIKYYEDGGQLLPEKDSNGNYLHSFVGHEVYVYSKLPSTTTYEATISDLIRFLQSANKGPAMNDRDEYLIPHDEFKAFIANINKEPILKITSNIENLYFNIFDTATGKTRLLKATNGEVSVDLTDFLNGDSSDILYITKPKVLTPYAYLEGVSDKVIEKLGTLEGTFDWIGPKNPSKLINSYTPLYSFFDSNNIYNKLTLPKIDFDASQFTIVGSSRS